MLNSLNIWIAQLVQKHAGSIGRLQGFYRIKWQGFASWNLLIKSIELSGSSNWLFGIFTALSIWPFE